MVAATHEVGTPASEQLVQGNYPSLLSQQRDSAYEKAVPEGGLQAVQDASEEPADVEGGQQKLIPDVMARATSRRVPRQVQNSTIFAKQLAKRVGQFMTYSVYIIPPALMTGFWCGFLLYAIKLVSALRNGTCGENTYQDFLNHEHPLVACTDVVGAHRWLIFLLSFCGMTVAALYTFFGNASAAGGMTTILQSIKAMEEEINRIGAEDARREASGEERSRIAESSNFRGMVALRMCPLVWIGTVSSHMFGASVGREGSALQMSAAIFSKYCDFVDSCLCRISPRYGLTVQFKRAGLVASIAAGFSGIFGVPITGAIFAVEVLRVGEITIGEMLIPAVVGSVFADLSCRYVNEHWFQFEGHSEYNCESCRGFPHTHGAADVPVGTPQTWYHYQNYTELSAILLAGLLFGLCGYAFEWLLHHFKDIFSKAGAKLAGTNATMKALLTPFIGGWVIVLCWLALCGVATTSKFNLSPTYSGNDPYSATFGQAYLGLSVYEPGVSISSCFNIADTWQNEEWQGPHGGYGTPVMSIMWYSWLIKLFLTTLSLGAGFKGGEVTPLFFIGASLGNWVGLFLGQDQQLFAGLGFVGVFAAAANTPIACTFMGIEMFGGSKALSFFIACYVSYLVSNSEAINGIYKQQKPRDPNAAVVPHSRQRPTLV